jgi:hypothetical protein
MVEDTVTDGKRIAQLLASELTGLETGTLATVAVVDADEEATPSDSGTFAYRVAGEEAEIAEVSLFPERVEVRFAVDPERVPAAAERDLFVEARTLALASGAAVKPAVDVIRETAAVVEG